MPKLLKRLTAFLTSRAFLFPVGGLIGLFLLLNHVVLPIYVRHGGTMTVPAVTDMPLADAEGVLKKSGLEPVHTETRPDPQRPEGVVVYQNPSAGSVVKGGRRVYLVVSGGEILVPVPALQGLSVRDARFRLERSGLVAGEVTTSTSESFFANTVMGQSVAAGAQVSRGTAVALVVSVGASADETEVPDVTGRTAGEAEKVLVDAGLKAGTISYQPHEQLLPNTVIDQYPRAGDRVSRGRAVDLFVVGVRVEGEVIE
jgi:serine/threonine-protein kinase